LNSVYFFLSGGHLVHDGEQDADQAAYREAHRFVS